MPTTTFSELLCNYVTAVDTDDIRWKTELSQNPALFLREKSLYVISAVPRFNRPPELSAYLTYTAPSYDDYDYTATAAETSPITIQTGKTGYELCSAGLSGINQYGNAYYTPISNTYDATTGNVTISTDLSVGQTVQFDFYTDGSFTNSLTDWQKRILGLCITESWYMNLASNFLNIQLKIQDSSFPVKSENENIRTLSERIKIIRRNISDEIQAYEQACQYQSITNKHNTSTKLV